MVYNIYPIPFKFNGPPYMERLYGATEGEVAGSIFKRRPFSWSLIWRSLKKERHVVHIHWSSNIFGSRYWLVSTCRMLWKFSALVILRIRGIKLIWTTHNMHNHDYPHPNMDDLGNFILWHLVDRVIIQEKSFAASEKARRRTQKIACVPPGDYINANGPIWEGDRTALRKAFGIKDNEVALLSLGSIRPYKELPRTIDTFRKARSKGATIRLLIAGKAEPKYAKVIDSHIGHDPSITMHSDYIPSEKIPEYLAAADYTIDYYGDSALGSAAIMLSLSYGTPVITRNFPASELVIRGKTGWIFYDDEELENLLSNLKPLETPKSEIVDSIREQNWEQAGRKLREVIQNLYV